MTRISYNPVLSAGDSPARSPENRPFVASGGSAPEALIIEGKTAAAYIMTPENLFQMSDGTVPVTSDGDVVGYVTDLSGNGHHMTQSTTGRKPFYRTAGNGIQAEDTSSTTREFITSSVAYSLAAGVTFSCFFAVRPQVTTTGSGRIVSTNDETAGANFFASLSRTDGLGIGRHNSTQTTATGTNTYLQDATNYVAGFIHDPTANTLVSRFDGVQKASVADTNNASGDQFFTLFAEPDGGTPAPRLRAVQGIGFYFGDLTADEISQIETRLGELQP